jgi:hypothetical protein
MFTRNHFAQAADEALQARDRLYEQYEALLGEIEDEHLRLRLVGLRQDLRRQGNLILRLRSLIED